MKNTAYISLGSNIGDKIQNIACAISEITISIGQITQIASNYISEPWGFKSDEYFINTAITINTNHSPIELIKELQAIEKKMGRIRSSSNSYVDRIIDLDIIYYNNEIIDTIELKLPHPNLYSRKFVLLPLQEIAPNYIDPIKKITINELLQNCSDEGILEKVVNNNSL